MLAYLCQYLFCIEWRTKPKKEKDHHMLAWGAQIKPLEIPIPFVAIRDTTPQYFSLF